MKHAFFVYKRITNNHYSSITVDESTTTSFGAPMSNTPVTTVSEDIKKSALVMWIACIIFWILPALFFFFTKKEDAYLQDQSKEALNVGITFGMISIATSIILSMIGGILPGLLISLIVYLPMLVYITISVVGAMATSKGEVFRAFFAVRLIK
jgi:uncharacterized protein